MSFENDSDKTAENPVVRGTAQPPATNEPSPSARQLVRERAEQVKTRQARVRLARLIIIAVVVIAVLASAVFFITNTVREDASKPLVDPSIVDADGGLPVSAAASAFLLKKDAGASPAPTASPAATEATPQPTTSAGPVRVDVYVDYFSPVSGDFQAANAKQLAAFIEDGAITVNYHPIAMLTSKSNGTRYSERASNAVACVAESDANAFFQLNDQLLRKQPTADTNGYSDEELGDMAAAVSPSNEKAIRSCLDKGTFEGWVKKTTEAATEQPLLGTKDPLTEAPTIIVGGTKYVGSMKDPAEFSQFVMREESRAAYGTPTPTPEPTTSATPAATTKP